MDGQVLFDLSQLLKYKTHGFDEYDPTKLLSKKIDDKNVRDLIEHCIKLEPKSRWTPQKYLDFYKGKIFPKYFDNLYDLFKKFLDPTFSESDHKIKYLQKKYVNILKMVSPNNEFKKVPELFRKEKKHNTEINNNNNNNNNNNTALDSNMSLLSPTSPISQQVFDNNNIPKLEIIMRQQKLQQELKKQQEIIDENNAYDSYVFNI